MVMHFDPEERRAGRMPSPRSWRREEKDALFGPRVEQIKQVHVFLVGFGPDTASASS